MLAFALAQVGEPEESESEGAVDGVGRGEGGESAAAFAQIRARITG